VPEGTSRIRITVTAAHRAEEVDRCADEVARVVAT
jgi:7-keto-8-aminopelargonate synthetase-like enzyme